MKNFILGIAIGTIVGSSLMVYAYGDEDNLSRKKESYEQKMDKIDDFWFQQGGRGFAGKEHRSQLGVDPC